MIELNTNYNELITQHDRVKSNVYRDFSSLSCVSSYKTCRALELFYYLSTNHKIPQKNCKFDKLIYERANHMINQLVCKYRQSFSDNQSFHQQIVSSFSKEMSDFISDFYESDYYSHLVGQYHPKVRTDLGEDVDILYRFFDSVEPSMKELFLDLVEQKRFFKLNPNVSMTGVTLFNTVDHSSNVFIKEVSPSIPALATYVHEIVHVMDNLNLTSNFSPKEEILYLYRSLYSEVLSTQYEQKFYEFLIDNNIHKEEAILAAMHFFSNYLEGVEDSILYTSLPKKFHKKAFFQQLTFDQAVSILENSPFPSVSEDDIFPAFDDNLQYSYGLIVANHILYDKSLQQDFMNIRGQCFDKEKLSSLGVTSTTTKKKILTNIRKIIN